MNTQTSKITCVICNESFDTRRPFIYHLKKYHNLTLQSYYETYINPNKQTCKFCSNLVSFNSYKFAYNEVCSNKSCIGKLAQEKSKESILNKYGVDNVFKLKSTSDKSKLTKQKRYNNPIFNNPNKNKETCLDRYSVNNGSKTLETKNKISIKNKLNSKERIQKAIQTNIDTYGVKCTLQIPDIKEKKKETYIKNWGVDHPMKSDKFKETKIKQTLDKYGVEYVSQTEEFKSKVRKTNYEKRKVRLKQKFGDIITDFPDLYSVKITCPKCNKESILNSWFLEQRAKFDIDLCLHCTPYKIQSYVQQRLSEWIESLGFKVLNNHKIPGSSLEMDIYIPEKNLAIEYNGIHWHKELPNTKNPRGQYYHINKKQEGLKNNINIVFIWEDDYLIKEQLIKNKIKALLNIDIKTIGARECYIKEINRNEALNFFQLNHLQGFINSNVYIGLFTKDNILVSVISFGKRHKMQNNEYEIFRYATLFNYKINGGFNKLLSYFKKTYNPNSIKTYIDLDWANNRNNVYERNGFEYKGQTEPSLFYAVKGKREDRHKYQKKKLIKLGYDKNKSAKEILSELGIYPIWNCGNLKYILNY